MDRFDADEEKRLLTVLLDELKVEERDRENHDLRLRWHVFLEYRALVPGWIGEREATGADSSLMSIGDLRKDPITFDEAKEWAQAHWPPKPPGDGELREAGDRERREGWEEREARALARSEALRLGLGRDRSLDDDLEIAERLAVDYPRRLAHLRASGGHHGPRRGNSSQVANVHRVLMVHFLVYAGLAATRNEAMRQESACDAVGQATGRTFDSLKREWTRYKQFLPHRGATPAVGERHTLRFSINKNNPRLDSDVVRRIVHFSWIVDYIERHLWFIAYGLPPPVPRV